MCVVKCSLRNLKQNIILRSNLKFFMLVLLYSGRYIYLIYINRIWMRAEAVLGSSK